MGEVGRFKRVVPDVLAPLAVVGALLWAGQFLLDSDAPGRQECGIRTSDGAALQLVSENRKDHRRGLRRANAALAQAQAAAGRAPRDRRAARDLANAVREQSDAARMVRRHKPVTLTVSEGARTSFELGRDPTPGARTIDFSLQRRVPSGPRAVRAVPGRFRTADGGRELGREHLKAWAVLAPGRSAGTVFVCADPGRRASAPSGVFEGEVVFADPRIAPTAVPVTLSLSYTNEKRVALVGLVVCLLASMYVHFLRLPDGSLLAGDAALRRPFTFLRGYWQFVTGIMGVITIAAGVAAATAAFSAQYLAADAWAPDIGGWLTYCGAVGTAFVAGGTAGKLAKNSYYNADQQRRADDDVPPGGPGGDE